MNIEVAIIPLFYIKYSFKLLRVPTILKTKSTLLFSYVNEKG